LTSFNASAYRLLRMKVSRRPWWPLRGAAGHYNIPLPTACELLQQSCQLPRHGSRQVDADSKQPFWRFGV
jgi:hypothetical protein